MKFILNIFFALGIFTSGMAIAYSHGQEIPSGVRSQQAIARVKPKLEKELEEAGLQWGQPVFIRIFKKEMKLKLWVKQIDSRSYRLFKTYNICSVGRASSGPKIYEGDGKAPEGFYYFRPLDLNPFSNFHLSFNIGYPNQYDRYHNRSGSAIMIHGECRSSGCFAMTNASIEEIYAMVDAALRAGQPFIRAHIFPFVMTDRQMHRHRNSDWLPFWENLKVGYDLFNNNGSVPPNVRMSEGRYVFN